VLGFGRKKLPCDEIYCHFNDPKKVLRDFGAEINIYFVYGILIVNFLIFQIAAYKMIAYRLKHKNK
jgi:hypothetical protein